MKKFLPFVWLLLFVSLSLPAQIALADTGPKPTMQFTFKGEQVTITSGILYECEQSDCSDATPLQELGPQRFTCDDKSCSALAYGFRPYHKLEIQFSDGKTRQSNIFETAGFDSTYAVTVRADDLVVESQFIPTKMYPRTVTVLLLCACALVIGALVIGAIVFFLRRRAKS